MTAKLSMVEQILKYLDNSFWHAGRACQAVRWFCYYLSYINSEFSLGSAGLAAESRYLIDSLILSDLHGDSLDGKKHWLLSVRAARKASAAQLGNSTPPSTDQALWFRSWLGLPPTHHQAP